MANNSVLAKMAVKIAADTAEFKGALAKTQTELKGFQKNLSGIAASLAVSFGVSEIANFTFEVAKLGGEAKGVEAAFYRLQNAQRVLTQLKDATGGTVSELKLMKAAVQANNFQIPIENLAQLFKFATLRAQQTGQSVDYLVESIILGIGRKSPLILDNLGISAIRLREKLNGISTEAATVGDVAKVVGDIAEEELGNMAGFSQNAATEVQKLDAAWTNFKVSLGKKINIDGGLSFLTDIIKDFSGENKLFNAISSLGTAFNARQGEDDITIKIRQIKEAAQDLNKFTITNTEFEKIIAPMGRAAIVSNELKKALKEIGIEIVGLNKIAFGPGKEDPWFFKPPNGSVNAQVVTLESLQAKIKELNEQFEITNVNDLTKLKNIGNEILAINAQIETLEKLRKKQEEVATLQTKFAKDQAANAAKGVETKVENPVDLVALSPFNLQLAIPDITQDMTSYVENVNRGIESLEQWGIRMRLLSDIQEEEFERQKSSALAYGEIVGSALGDAISGQESAAQALKKITSSIVNEFLRQALAGIIASATKSEGPTPLALGLAAAGVAAIRAMFSKIGGSSGGGGGSSSASISRSASSNISKATMNSAQDSNPTLTTVIRGQDLFVILDNYSRNNKNTKLSFGS